MTTKKPPRHARRKRRPTVADNIIAQPDIQRYLQAVRKTERLQDIAALARLAQRMTGRVTRLVRIGRFWRVRLHRDPVAIAYRYLRRYRPGPWHVGGSHVARLDFGPGIGFRGWRNDQRIALNPIVLDR